MEGGEREPPQFPVATSGDMIAPGGALAFRFASPLRPV